MAFELPALPYAQDALEPHISANTMGFHYGKHHNTYVVNLNNLTDGTDLGDKSLEDVITATAANDAKIGIFNNAAQVWNHTFFWHCMTPNGGGEPGSDVMQEITKAFGSYDQFKEEFKQAAVTQFGSGWAWLSWDNGLKIEKTANAINPLSRGGKALMTCDVWEHAYYLDYQNRRPDFVEAFLKNLVNWDFVAENLAKAKG